MELLKSPGNQAAFGGSPNTPRVRSLPVCHIHGANAGQTNFVSRLSRPTLEVHCVLCGARKYVWGKKACAPWIDNIIAPVDASIQCMAIRGGEDIALDFNILHPPQPTRTCGCARTTMSCLTDGTNARNNWAGDVRDARALPLDAVRGSHAADMEHAARRIR